MDPLIKSKPFSICSNPDCKKPMSKSKFKICSVCRNSMYCSRECQREAWPIHKHYCTIHERLSAASVMFKVIKNMPNRDMCSEVDMIAAATLQLHEYPERAKTHTVVLLARMENEESGVLKDFLRAKLENWPSRTANSIPMTFQLARAVASLRPTAELTPSIRGLIEECFEAFVEGCTKHGVAPDDHNSPFRVIWTLDTPSGALDSGYTISSGLFLRKHGEFLRHYFAVYGAEGCAYTMLRNFNMKIITDPERMKKMTALTEKDNSK